MKLKWTSYPYIVWMAIFIIVPLLLILFFSVTSEDVFRLGEFQFTLDNFKRFMSPIYLKVLGRSITLALQSTAICFLLGYPMAMIISKAEVKKRNAMILLFVVPMWMNFLLRTYAWLTLLGKNGLINYIIKSLGFEPLNLIYNNKAILLGMVYNFLPFMVLPIYSVLIKIDNSLIEAAEDLGASKLEVFTRIILPLSIPGVVSGFTMVFMPAVSTFVISSLLGGGKYMLIGNLVEQQFLWSGDWNFGSAISIVMMIFILISMAIMAKFDEDKKGGSLW
ncbi:ABC transporter permease [Anaerosalibacter bizertensis]|uniref:ABC transporter permease n=1 Tax=Anaerosalibacter bizertensis TaxID=932217 RepID=A0A844FHZ3_9FIRM|nr:ABC transporter permease [Anaerosalibacter bizertensis]MBV1820200.1 ABC transporter permease [Bacteroidales bacterium MSK.15.36]MBU5294737.1 ABC transporter permease [Anaerosalibacter bizertensis]MCB5558681.1 ABC transporter permease [Anaerosalibacter bizertensis]MCG4565806.1 ABC transporter permease [Anaerosalibacter bizertensis]MCG4583169.1 ABC transporter permease [Anaerosalibacter bizertensis]